MPLTIASLFAAWADGDPTAECLVDETGRTWTRSEFTRHLLSVADVLRARGFGPGTHVAIVDGASRQHLDVEYAVMLSGAVRVPMDPKLTVDEIAAQVIDGHVSLVAVGGPATALIAPLREALPDVEVIDITARQWCDEVASAAPRPTAPTSPDSLASLNFSGGTTGSPKAIMLTESNIVAVVRTVIDHTSVDSGPVFLNVRPLWPISAIIVLARLLGGAKVVLAPFDVTTFTSLVHAHAVTSTSLVPTQVVRLLDSGITADGLESLRVLDVGAAPLPEDACEALLRLLGARIGVNYGLTEAPWSCYLTPAEYWEQRTAVPSTQTVGRPFPGYGARVVDASGHVCPDGTVGEIQLRGPHLMQGYWNRPDLTSQALVDGWFRTGDLGRFDDGYLAIVGRTKEVIRTGGKSVLPAEVEAVLRQHPSVADAAVIGIPDREWGEVVAAYVELLPGRSAAACDLIEHVRGQVASYKKPRVVRVVQKLPRSHYGKVQKSQLGALADVQQFVRGEMP